MRFKPGHLKKKGLSQDRWLAYSAASTYSEFRELHDAYRLAHPHERVPTATAELYWDLAHGLVAC
jgi:hypothetical protein